MSEPCDGSNDENFSLKMHHFAALVFLPTDEIPGVFNEIKLDLPEEANKVTDWFKINYVHSRIRRQSCNVVAAELFLSKLWSVYENMLTGFPYIQSNIDVGKESEKI